LIYEFAEIETSHFQVELFAKPQEKFEEIVFNTVDSWNWSRTDIKNLWKELFPKFDETHITRYNNSYELNKYWDINYGERDTDKERVKEYIQCRLEKDETRKKQLRDIEKANAVEGREYKVFYVEYLAKYFMDLSKWKFNRLYHKLVKLGFIFLAVVIAFLYSPTFIYFSNNVHEKQRHWKSSLAYTIYIGFCYYMMY
jgi:hypothetical protein